MSAAWVVVIATLALAAQVHGQAEVSFPESGKCGPVGSTYSVDFQSVEVDGAVYTRHLTAYTSCIESSRKETLPADSKLDCAVQAADNKYNSFIYKNGVCKAFAYFAQKCRVNPAPNGDGNDAEVYIVNNKKTEFSPSVVNFQWRLGGRNGFVKATFDIQSLCIVDRVIVELSNGTAIDFKAQAWNTVEVPVDTPTCDEQDLTIKLVDSYGTTLFSKTYERDVCPSNSEDYCYVCAGVTRSDQGTDKVNFASLSSACATDALPTVRSLAEKDTLLHIAETSDLGPFWVGFNRGKDNSFTWPDGSADLSHFANSASFQPASHEACSVAMVNIVTMELMISPKSCETLQHGVCFTKK